MDMKKRIVTLPNKEEMVNLLSKLKAVDVPLRDREKLYSILLRWAGYELNIPSVVMAIKLSIDEYVHIEPLDMNNQSYALIPVFVRALVDDPGLAREAEDLYREIFS
jgi:hypothetical protein